MSQHLIWASLRNFELLIFNATRARELSVRNLNLRGMSFGNGDACFPIIEFDNQKDDYVLAEGDGELFYLHGDGDGNGNLSYNLYGTDTRFDLNEEDNNE
jgi:hypothetical protein